MEWMFLPLKRYADFKGRSPRIEYWLFHLFMWGVIFALIGIPLALFDGPGPSSGAGEYGDANPLMGAPIVIGGLFYLALWLPSLAVTVRRLHDRDMSGWFYLISFIPYIGWLILLVFMLLPGTPGENSYGDDPFDPSPEDLEEVFY